MNQDVNKIAGVQFLHQLFTLVSNTMLQFGKYYVTIPKQGYPYTDSLHGDHS